MKVLASNCFLVKGYKKNLLIDLQNQDWYHIFEDDTDLLSENLSIEKKEYLSEKGLLLDIPPKFNKYFPKYDFSYKSFPKIESCIIDFNGSSSFDILSCLKKLDNFNIQFIQLRFFDFIPDVNFVKEFSSALKSLTIESFEVIMPFDLNFYNYINQTQSMDDFFKLSRLIFYNFGVHKKVLSPSSTKFYFTSEKIVGSSNCGQINFFNFSNNKNHVLKSINYNSCLFKKIGIDVNGNIKNCPSLPQVIGNIMDDNLVLNLESLSTSKIKKDDIDVCKDCEFRYICTDCRAFTDSNSRPNARPSKCQYNPYISKWSHEDEYKSLVECGVISNEHEFSIDHEKIALINKEIWGE